MFEFKILIIWEKVLSGGEMIKAMKITTFKNYGTIMEHWLTVVCTEWDANKSCIIIWSWEKDEKNAVWFLFFTHNHVL